MRTVRRSFWEIQNRIAELVELLIVCHPQGFRVLLGEVPPPMSKEIHEMMNAGRDKLPDDFVPTMPNLLTEAERIVFDREYFDRSVELAGGWPHIHLVSREYRDSDSRMWSVVMDHVKFVGNALSRHASKLGYVAVRYGLSPNTVMKYRREFSGKLAEMLLMPTGEGEDFRHGSLAAIFGEPPNKDMIENIRTMLHRSVSFFEELGVISAGFDFAPSGYTKTVHSGDGDFLTADTLWDMKVYGKNTKITKNDTLQILMYWIMGQHSGQEIFKPVTKIGLYNSRQNVAYTLDVAKIPASVIREVETKVICY